MMATDMDLWAAALSAALVQACGHVCKNKYACMRACTHIVWSSWHTCVLKYINCCYIIYSWTTCLTLWSCVFKKAKFVVHREYIIYKYIPYFIAGVVLGLNLLQPVLGSKKWREGGRLEWFWLEARPGGDLAEAALIKCLRNLESENVLKYTPKTVCFWIEGSQI